MLCLNCDLVVAVGQQVTAPLLSSCWRCSLHTLESAALFSRRPSFSGVPVLLGGSTTISGMSWSVSSSSAIWNLTGLCSSSVPSNLPGFLSNEVRDVFLNGMGWKLATDSLQLVAYIFYFFWIMKRVRSLMCPFTQSWTCWWSPPSYYVPRSVSLFYHVLSNMERHFKLSIPGIFSLYKMCLLWVDHLNDFLKL